MNKNILLTGKPGIGKSSVISKIVIRLGTDRIGGFWSGEIKEGSRRVGFSIITTDGKRGVLAHTDLGHGPRFGKYYVNLDDIEKIAIPSLYSAKNSRKIILIDEIAAMELLASSFKSAVLSCLETRRVLGTIQQKSTPFLNSIKSRIDVTMVEVTLHNREELPMQILAVI